MNDENNDSTGIVVTDNPAESRYELRIGDELVSLADYRRSGNVVTVPHVETRPSHGGNGYAAMLMDGIIDDLRARSLTIVPSCPYAAAYMRDRPDTHDLYAA
jgi:uncharacterized protein